MTQLPRLDPIKYLLSRKFGASAIVEDGELEGAPIDAALAQRILDYKESLTALPQYKLSKLFADEQARALYDEHRFNSLSAQADYDYWSRMPHWTLDEAIALTFGKAPEQINWSKIQGSVDHSTIAFEYRRRRELAIRATSGKLISDPVVPREFVAWAEEADMVLPVDLKVAVLGRGIEVTDWQALSARLKATVDEQNAVIEALRSEIEELRHPLMPIADPEKDLRTRERTSLVTLVIGMAIGGYGYDPSPDVAKSDVPGLIAKDLDSKGLSLDLKTIRKYLTEGVELLPRDIGS